MLVNQPPRLLAHQFAVNALAAPRFAGESLSAKNKPEGQPPTPAPVKKKGFNWSIFTPSGMKGALSGMADAVSLYFQARGLKKKLRSPKVETRLSTLSPILEISTKTPRRARLQVEMMLLLSQDKDEKVRLIMAKELGNTWIHFDKDVACPPKLWEGLLTDASTEVKKAALQSATKQLMAFPMPAIAEPLKVILKDADPALRISLSELMTTWENPGLINQFLPALVADADPTVRKASVKTVKKLINPGGSFDSRKALPFLKQLAADSDMTVRRALIQKIPTLLLKAQDKLALMDRMSDGATPSIRSYLVLAAAQLPDDAAVPALRRYALNLNPEIRRKAALASGHLSEDTAKAAVLALSLSDPSSVVKEAAKSVIQASIFSSDVRNALLK